MDVESRYPRAGKYVDGLLVRDRVPNLSSIDGYFDESETLRGVRIVSMSDFGGPRTVFYAADDFERSERLAEAIAESGEINPLIVGVDKEGPFIIEGAHRFVALYYLKKKEFPAVVVIDLEGRNPMRRNRKNPNGMSNTEIALLVGGIGILGCGIWYVIASRAANVAGAQATPQQGLPQQGQPPPPPLPPGGAPYAPSAPGIPGMSEDYPGIYGVPGQGGVTVSPYEGPLALTPQQVLESTPS